MSFRSKVTLVSSCVFTAGVVYFVHHNQDQNKVQMRSGIVKELETITEKQQQLSEKAQENLDFMLSQQKLTEKLVAEREEELKAKRAAATAASS